MSSPIPFPDISPEIFSITVFGADFALRWYALAYILGIIIAWWISARAVKNVRLWAGDTPPMTPRHVEDLVTWAILGVIIGGRLGYVLFYKPTYYLANPLEIPQVWDGGMSFHGGFLGVVIAAWIFTRRHHLPVLSSADMVALGVPWGLMLGRMANFINAELWGRPTDLPWAVAFPGEAAQSCPDITGVCGRHPSQLYEAGLEGLVLGLVLIWLAWGRRGLHRPGMITGVFIAGYGLARFVVEFFRQADDHFISAENPMGYVIRLGDLGMTMGQVLTLPMITVGLWLALRSRPAS